MALIFPSAAGREPGTNQPGGPLHEGNGAFFSRIAKRSSSKRGGGRTGTFPKCWLVLFFLLLPTAKKNNHFLRGKDAFPGRNFLKYLFIKKIQNKIL